MSDLNKGDMYEAAEGFVDKDGVVISKGQLLGFLIRRGEGYFNTILHGKVTCVTKGPPPLIIAP